MFPTQCRAIWKEFKMEEDRVNRLTMDLLNVVRAVFEAEAAKDTAATPQLKRVLA